MRIIISTLILLLISTAPAFARSHKSVTHHVHHAKPKANASWYGPGFHDKKTASGERFNMYAMTAAHKTLKLGTKVRVTNLSNLKSVLVTINDRGPYIRGRVIDLSLGAARRIGIKDVGRVKLDIIKTASAR